MCLPVDLFNNQHNNIDVEQHSYNKPHFNGCIIIVDATFTQALTLSARLHVDNDMVQAAVDNKEHSGFDLALSHRH